MFSRRFNQKQDLNIMFPFSNQPYHKETVSILFSEAESGDTYSPVRLIV